MNMLKQNYYSSSTKNWLLTWYRFSEAELFKPREKKQFGYIPLVTPEVVLMEQMKH